MVDPLDEFLETPEAVLHAKIRPYSETSLSALNFSFFVNAYVPGTDFTQRRNDHPHDHGHQAMLIKESNSYIFLRGQRVPRLAKYYAILDPRNITYNFHKPLALNIAKHRPYQAVYYLGNEEMVTNLKNNSKVIDRLDDTTLCYYDRIRISSKVKEGVIDVTRLQIHPYVKLKYRDVLNFVKTFMPMPLSPAVTHLLTQDRLSYYSPLIVAYKDVQFSRYGDYLYYIHSYIELMHGIPCDIRFVLASSASLAYMKCERNICQVESPCQMCVYLANYIGVVRATAACEICLYKLNYAMHDDKNPFHAYVLSDQFNAFHWCHTDRFLFRAAIKANLDGFDLFQPDNDVIYMDFQECVSETPERIGKYACKRHSPTRFHCKLSGIGVARIKRGGYMASFVCDFAIDYAIVIEFIRRHILRSLSTGTPCKFNFLEFYSFYDPTRSGAIKRLAVNIFDRQPYLGALLFTTISRSLVPHYLLCDWSVDAPYHEISTGLPFDVHTISERVHTKSMRLHEPFLKRIRANLEVYRRAR